MTRRVHAPTGTWTNFGTTEPPATPATIALEGTFSYDAASRIIATTRGTVKTAHTYAGNGLPLTETCEVATRVFTMSRTYDSANRPISHTFADGKVMNWVYDAWNMVASATYDGEPVLTQSHDPGQRLTSQTFGNGLERSISFGRQDNLRTKDKVKDATTIEELDFDYTYTADKNVLREANADGALQDLSFSAAYDPGDRVTTWQRDDNYPGARKQQSWNYDAAGNWAATSIDGNTLNRTNDSSDRATAIGGGTLTYSSQGNLTKDETGQKYLWSIDNRLTKADLVAGNDITYQYDAFGRRVYRVQGTSKEVLLWWGNSEYAEHKEQASKPVIQNDLHAAPAGLNTTFGRALEGSKHDIQYFHKNYLDHVYAVSDDNGNVIEQYRYAAFGEPEVFDATGTKLAKTAIDNDILWNVRRYGWDSGLYMYKYRDYLAKHGRWLSRDPIEEAGGVNLYGAAWTNLIL